MITDPSHPDSAGASCLHPLDVIQVAAFCCDGLERLSKDLGFSIAVVAAVRDTDRYIQLLSDTWYASGISPVGSEWSEPSDFDNSHFREWWKKPIEERWLKGTIYPLSKCIENGSLVIRLPISVSAERFSVSFRNGLSALRFEGVARRSFHRGRRQNEARQASIAPRYSRTSTTDLTPVKVLDLVSFHPQTIPRIADIAFMTLVRLIAMNGVK